MDKRNTILIVDDAEINRAILHQLFKDSYTVLEAENGKDALALIETYQLSLCIILLDIVMPEMDGFGVLETMRQKGLLEKIPVILITGDNSITSAKRGYDFGTADIINKPFDLSIVARRVENVVELYRHKNHLEELLAEQTRQITMQSKKIKEFDSFLIDTLSTIVEFRSLESGLHISRIRKFTKVLLEYISKYNKSLHLTPEMIDMISSASALHDIGKIAIPDAILLKPGKLTPAEFEVMKTHALKGCEILSSMTYLHDKEYFQCSYDICRSHHERWDGGGYPDGLVGNEIPLSAQIVSIADVYDALVSERVYKPAYTHKQAVLMIINGKCGCFSPDLLECFLKAQEDLERLLTIDNLIAIEK